MISVTFLLRLAILSYLHIVVLQVCTNRSGEINPTKIRELVEGYIKKVKYYRKKENTHSSVPHSTTPTNSNKANNQGGSADHGNSNSNSTNMPNSGGNSMGSINNNSGSSLLGSIPTLMNPSGSGGDNPPPPSALLTGGKAAGLLPLSTIENKA